MGEQNMKESAIQIRKTYEVAVGRGTAIVKIIGINHKTGAWLCETQNGKGITIGDTSRFLKAIGEAKGAKKGKPPKQAAPKPEAAKQAAPSPAGKPRKGKAEAAPDKPVADPARLERFSKEFKEADKRLRAAKNAFDFGLIDQDKLDDTTAGYDDALAALRAAGGKAGSGGRCLGQMSGLEAAYKVLSEAGTPMNIRQIYDTAIEKGYWNPQGATPEATMSSAILTEMKKKGDDSRFERTGRGLFAVKK